MPKTLFDKIWDAHLVQSVPDGPDQLYIDRLYCHEVTSPQAFQGLRQRGLPVFRPAAVVCMPDHNIPTERQEEPIRDPIARTQVETLTANVKEFGLKHYGVMDERSGILHVVGPERGLTLPGATVVCGDSHTSTHGAMGCVAFGIGTSEVEMVLASGCILQSRPKTMRIVVDGVLGKGVTAKDVALFLMSRLGTAGATGHFVEYAGSAVTGLTMEGRLTLCNLSIEMGARGGMIAPDQTTFDYLAKAPEAPKGAVWEASLAFWKTLRTDDDAVFDREVHFAAGEIAPWITYGTNPGMGMAVDGAIPPDAPARPLEYMGFQAGERLLGKPVDYVFVGACTNGRVEDFRASEGGACRGVAGAGFLDGAAAAAEGGRGGRSERSGLPVAPTWLFCVSGHERGPCACGEAVRLHQQPELRGAPGPRRPDRPGQPPHRGGGGNHRKDHGSPGIPPRIEHPFPISTLSLP